MSHTASRWLATGLAVMTAAVALVATALLASAQTTGFVDVPQDAYFATPVADLQADGVFDGTLCAEGFCPLQPIDRKTMAVWIVRVLDGQDPPSITGSRFADVDPSGFHARFIERLAELGVTSGCGDRAGFCPDRTVTRAQAAVLLSRAYDLPAGSDPGFDDAPDNAWYADDVARLVASGITAGCKTTQFCPSQDTTRGQLATFLWRANPPARVHVVLDAEYVELSEIAAEYRPGQPINITVHYCGLTDRVASEPNLSRLVSELNNAMKRFFENQSRATDSGDIQQRINFVEGRIGFPNVSSAEVLDEVNRNGNSYAPYRRVCFESVTESTRNRQVLILLDATLTPGWNGVALYGGPAISLTHSHLGDGHLGIVAHEFAHAFYVTKDGTVGLRHPWADYLQLCNVINDIGGLQQLQTNEREDCGDYIKENPEERLPEEQAREMLRSLLSYRFGHPVYSAIRNLDSAYLACYQRESLGWLSQGACDDPPATPSTPLPPRLEFVGEILQVSWSASTADTLAPVTDYNVQYRVAERNEQWTDVQHHGDELFTRIPGLMDGLLYEVRVQAVNRIGPSGWSAPERLTKPGDPGSDQRVVLTVGSSAQGEPTNAGPCGAQCRWLHVELQNFPRALIPWYAPTTASARSDPGAEHGMMQPCPCGRMTTHASSDSPATKSSFWSIPTVGTAPGTAASAPTP